MKTFCILHEIQHQKKILNLGLEEKKGKKAYCYQDSQIYYVPSLPLKMQISVCHICAYLNEIMTLKK